MSILGQLAAGMILVPMATCIPIACAYPSGRDIPTWAVTVVIAGNASAIIGTALAFYLFLGACAAR